MGAHRSRASGPPQPKRNRVDYYASAQTKDRVIPENWEDEVLDDTSDAGSPDAPAAGEAAIEESDGAVAASQLGLPPSEDMEVGQPPAAAAPRPLRIKKKPKPPGLLAPAGATAATANSDARPPGAATLRKHVWQNVDIVRADLGNSFRPRSTEEDVNAVRQFRPLEDPGRGIHPTWTHPTWTHSQIHPNWGPGAPRCDSWRTARPRGRPDGQ